MKKTTDTLATAKQIYCRNNESLAELPQAAKKEAIRFCVSNDVSPTAAAKEFGVPVDQVRELCKDLH